MGNPLLAWRATAARVVQQIAKEIVGAAEAQALIGALAVGDDRRRADAESRGRLVRAPAGDRAGGDLALARGQLREAQREFVLDAVDERERRLAVLGEDR